VIALRFALRRLPRLSRGEFQRIWREEHGPLVLRHAAALGIRRYVQLHTVATPLDAALRESRAAPEAFDGVAELWFESLEAMGARLATPEAQAAARALLEDERRFIDHARSPLWLGEEHVVLP
jgi:uncharacterized protein (TIGR02118 family)